MNRLGSKKTVRIAVTSALALALLAAGAVVAYGVTGPNGVKAEPRRGPDNNGFYTGPVTVDFSGTVAEDTCVPSEDVYSGSNISSDCTSAADPTVTYSDTFGAADWPYDDESPEVQVPGDITVDATSAAGAVVNFGAQVTATGGPDPTCEPESGSTFALSLPPANQKTTSVTCTSTDAAGHSDSKSFNVIVRDITGPAIGSVSDETKDGNVLGGYKGDAYTVPSASDTVDGGVTPSCDPGPTEKFNLGKTEVTCTASDARGNDATPKKFDVMVVDNDKPEFRVHPQNVTVQAGNIETGTPTTNACIQEFLTSPTAGDVVYGPIAVAHDSTRDRFPVGDTTVTFTAEDGKGNVATETAVVTVARGPQGKCTIDADAPANVRGVSVRESSQTVVLRWRNPRAKDFWRVEITRSRSDGEGGTRTFTTKREILRDRRLRNNVEYSYVLRSVDEAGNKPRGVARLATPHRILLLRPRDQSKVLVKRPPLLDWVAKKRARYYNVQLYRIVKGNARKVLSRWPSASKYKLTKTWRFEGRRQRFRSGRYVWYVWPGYGPRSANRYGDVMGSSVFRVVKRR